MADFNPEQVKRIINRAIPNLKWAGYNASGRVPWRKDKNPSFSLKVDEKGAAWHDFGRGESGNIHDLFKRMGITNPLTKQFTQNDSSPDKDSFKTIYEYLDEQGELLFRVVRIDRAGGGKNIYQQSPDGKGGYKKGRGGAALVPYRLPDLKKSLAGGEKRIFWVEGEKCVELLLSLGLTATTSPMGASAWKPDVYTHFIPKETEIIILPDVDPNGKKYAQKVAESFMSRGNRVKIADLTGGEQVERGYDIYDWIIKDGHTKTELLKIVDNTPYRDEEDLKKTLPRIYSAAELWDREFPEPKWAVPGIVPEGLSILAGAPKIGKSWMALQMAIAVSSGGRFLGKSPKQGKTLYLALEDTPRRFKDRIKQLALSKSEIINLHAPFEWPRGSACISALETWLKLNPDARLVIIDTFKMIRPRQFHNRNVYDVDYEDMGALKKLADRHGTAILLIHHTRKSKSGETQNPLESINGSFGVAGAADTSLVLQRHSGKADGKLYITGRDVEEQELTLIKDRDVGWIPRGETNPLDYLSPQQREILRFIGGAGMDGITAKQVSENLDISKGCARGQLKRLSDQELIFSPVRGRYAVTQEAVTFVTAYSSVTGVTPVSLPFDENVTSPVGGSQILSASALKDINDTKLQQIQGLYPDAAGIKKAVGADG